MNETSQTDNTIILDGRINLEDYKIYWRDVFLRDLPNVLIFWGIFAGGAFLLGWLLRDNSFGKFFLMFSLLVAATPILMTVFNYRSFMNASRKYIDSLSESELYYNIIIYPDGKGIEFMRGENFSLIAWSSIKGAFERERYFCLDYQINPFLIMKRGFRDESEISLFRKTLAAKLGAKGQLLP